MSNKLWVLLSLCLFGIGACQSDVAAQLTLVGEVEAVYHESDAHACPPGASPCYSDPAQSVMAIRTRIGFDAAHAVSQDLLVYGRGSIVGTAINGVQQKDLSGLVDLALGLEAGPAVIELGQVGDNRGAQMMPTEIDQLYTAWQSHPIEDFFRLEQQRLSVGLQFDDWGLFALSDDDGHWLASANMTFANIGWFYDDLYVGGTIGDDLFAASADWSDDDGSLFFNYIFSSALGKPSWSSHRSMHQANLGFRQTIGGAEILASYAKQYFEGTSGGTFWFDQVRAGLEYQVAPGLSLIAAADKQWHSEPSGQFNYQVHNYHLGFKAGF